MCLSDIHASDRPPSSCTDSYGQDILDMLRTSMTLARLRGAVAVVWAGDVFHLKAPGRTSHRLVLDMVRIIQEAPCEVLIAPGNHDMQNDRAESLEATQPLGVLFQAGARRLDGWGSPFKLYGVPWLQGYGAYTEESDYAVGKAFDAWRSANIKPGEPCLVVTHAPLYPPGTELEWENFPAARWAEAMGGVGQVFYGHVHEPHGVWTAGGVTFCNNGALSRGSLHEYNLLRTPGVTWWDDQTGKFEFQELPNAKPASEVFRLQEKQQVTDMNGRLDEFLEGVSGTSLGVVDTVSVLEHVRTLNLGKPVETLIEELLEYAASGGNK